MDKKTSIIIYPAGAQRDLWLDHESLTTMFIAEQLSEIKNRNNNIELQKLLNDKLIISRDNSIKYFKNLNVKWPTETDMIKKIIDDERNLEDFPKNILIEEVLNPEKYPNESRPDTISNYKSFITKYKIYSNS